MFEIIEKCVVAINEIMNYKINSSPAGSGLKNDRTCSSATSSRRAGFHFGLLSLAMASARTPLYFIETRRMIINDTSSKKKAHTFKEIAVRPKVMCQSEVHLKAFGKCALRTDFHLAVCDFQTGRRHCTKSLLKEESISKYI